MAEDDDFLKMIEEDKVPSDVPLLNKNNVIERKIMTMTTFRIYPNGMMSHPVSKSWFQDKYGTIVKKKEPKKTAHIEQAIIQEDESY